MASRTDLAAILARFPGPVTLYPSRKKWLTMLAGGVLFAILGALIIGGVIHDDRPWWFTRTFGPATFGWLVLILSAAGALQSAIVMLPGACALRLGRNGFEVTHFFRRRRTRWRDVTDFTAARIRPSHLRVVVYNDARASTRLIARVNVAISGRNADLRDTYGLSADELAELMAAWRASALARE
jgi:hypothetical protein